MSCSVKALFDGSFKYVQKESAPISTLEENVRKLFDGESEEYMKSVKENVDLCKSRIVRKLTISDLTYDERKNLSEKISELCSKIKMMREVKEVDAGYKKMKEAEKKIGDLRRREEDAGDEMRVKMVYCGLLVHLGNAR